MFWIQQNEYDTAIYHDYKFQALDAKFSDSAANSADETTY